LQRFSLHDLVWAFAAARLIDFYEQDLAIAREIGDRHGEGSTLGGLGNAYASLGEIGCAIEFFEQHLVVAREIGDRRGEALTSGKLGYVLAKQGDLARAAELIQVNVDYYRLIGHPDAEQRMAYLDHLRQRFATSQSQLPAETFDGS